MTAGNALTRSSGRILHVVCGVGIAIALVLTAREAAHTAAVSVGTAHHTRIGSITRVEVEVTNHTGASACPVVHAVVRDRDGRSLYEISASQSSGSALIGGHSKATYDAAFDRITRTQYREKVGKFTAYVFGSRTCGQNGRTASA